jgi:hypothetical protein
MTKTFTEVVPYRSAKLALPSILHLAHSADLLFGSPPADWSLGFI